MVALTGLPLQGQQDSRTVRPTIPAVKVNPAPVIDGDLSDQAWQEAFKITEFFSMIQEQARFYEKTEAYVCYDDRHLYIAFRCYDSQPQLIKAQQRKRGWRLNLGDEEGLIPVDDIVFVMIDPLNRVQFVGGATYTFAVNPNGAQTEDIPGGAAAKIEWRGDWKAATKMDDRGWSAEMAIPFQILRLPPDPRYLGLAFFRALPPPRLEAFSFPYRRREASNNSAEWGPADIPRQDPPVLTMPYTSLGAGAGVSGLRTGLDIKQHLPNGLQWQATLNPDFRTIEDVVETIDFTYVPRLLPDRRPFFAEGQGYLPRPFMFQTRLISDVVAGTKVFGKVGRTSVGLLSAYESGDRLSIGSRFGYDINKFVATRLEYAHRTKSRGSPAHRLSLRANFPTRKGWTYNFGAEWAKMDSDGWELEIGRWPSDPGKWGFYASLEQRGRLRPSIGFIPERDYRDLDVGFNYFDRPEKGSLLGWGCFLDFSERTHRGARKGQILDRSRNLGFFAQTRSGWSGTLFYNHYDRPPFRDRVIGLDINWNSFDQYRRGGLSVSIGRRGGRAYRFVTLSQGLRLADRFSLNLSFEHLSRQQKTYQAVLSGVYDLDWRGERSLVFRFVKGSVPEPGNPLTLLPVNNGYIGFRQVLPRGADIFLLIGDPNARQTEFKALLKIVQVY